MTAIFEAVKEVFMTLRWYVTKRAKDAKKKDIADSDNAVSDAERFLHKDRN